MSGISTTGYAQAASAYSTQTKAAENKKTDAADGKNKVSGTATFGDARLSDEALDYYNSLKKKYGNMNFVLVASDKKAEAEAAKGSFASSGKLTVLIDTDKIEKMATDKAYRQKYESILSNATSGAAQMKSQLAASGISARAFGMSFDDKGTAKFFAVIDKSLATQKERIEKNAEKKAESKKTEAKKAAKKQQADRLEDSQEQIDNEDTVTISANSIEELIKKVQDYYMSSLSDSVVTEEEKSVGQSVDFAV